MSSTRCHSPTKLNNQAMRLERARELSVLIACHQFSGSMEGANAVKARSLLKHAVAVVETRASDGVEVVQAP